MESIYFFIQVIIIAIWFVVKGVNVKDDVLS